MVQDTYSHIISILLKYVPMPILRVIHKAHYAGKRHMPFVEKEPDMKILSCLVRPGDHVVDIGAHVGVYTRILSGLVGRNGLVYSIEPIPQTFDILSSNISKYSLSNVVPINIAISESNDIVTMGIPRYLRGADNYYRAHVINGIAEKRSYNLEVGAMTLDTLFYANLDRFSFVKCFVEGHELACLKGAKNFLTLSKASWLVEVSGDPDAEGSKANNLFHEFASEGYTAWRFDGTRLFERQKGDTCTSCYFFSPKHLDPLKLEFPHFFDRA